MRLGLAARVTLFTLMCYAPAGFGAEILTNDVQYKQGVYRVRFAVRVQAHPDAVRALMTDYARLSRLSDVVTAAEVVQRFADGRQRLRLRLHACVWIFCKDLRKLEDVATLANGDIVTTALPAESDFLHAVERWRIADGSSPGNRDGNSGGTRIDYESEMSPNFFVPPLIGPALIKRALRRELTRSLETLERLAA